MRPRFTFPDATSIPSELHGGRGGESDAEHQSNTIRYVIGAVNDDALKAWSDLWDELRDGVTPAGLVLPEMSEGFTPSCGWPEFLEKFWLLKHYLDYIHRFCREPS